MTAPATSTAFVLPEGVTIVERCPFNTGMLTKGQNPRPVLNRRIQEVLLSTGQVVYGCAECDYLTMNRNGVRPHLNAHRTTKRGSRLLSRIEVPQQSDAARSLQRRLNRAQQRIGALTAERDEARRDLEALKRVLRVQ